jgi:Xaa-Pro dipeptidase
MQNKRIFPAEEYARRLASVRALMAERGLDACLISAPENVFYLTGLEHQGYFAYELLIVPLEGECTLITRAMEAATVRDQVPDVHHAGYSDGIEPLPPPHDRSEDVLMARPLESGEVAGLMPWEMSYGIATRTPAAKPVNGSQPIEVTCRAIAEAGLTEARLGLEKSSSFLPYRIAEAVVERLPKARWRDISGLVEDCRIVQSPLELKYTRRAAAVSDSMMLSAIAAAGPGVYTRDVMAAVYDAMFRRGGTYPGFVPLVRSTGTLQHEHGTWQPGVLRHKDMLFLEMSGCVRRYHAPIGRLVFIGKAPAKAHRIQRICQDAMQRAAETIGPGVKAGEVYQAWHSRLDEAGLSHYRRHHCGYAVGIGFPPSWSGSGTPVGLRGDSTLELRPGMVFHLMSWLLRTRRGDSFMSDAIVVTESGCEFLTKTPHEVAVR